MSALERDAADPARATPCTWALAVLLVAVFAVRQLTQGFPEGTLFGPGPGVGARGGALNPDLVLWAGEWWRLFTAPLLHLNVVHLGMNLIVLLMSGCYVERALGTPVLLVTLAAGAVAGSALSCNVPWPDWTSVGASGAIMSLVAVGVIAAYFLFSEEEEARTHRGERLAGVLVASLLPHNKGVDYAAHFGGALAGGALGLALCAFPNPALRGLLPSAVGWLVAVGYAGCAAFGFYTLAQQRPAFDLAWQPLTAQQVASLPAAPIEVLRALHAQDPGDPRPAESLARAEIRAGDPASGLGTAIEGLRALRAGRSDIRAQGLDGRLRAEIALARVALGLDHPAPGSHLSVCADAGTDKDLGAMMRAAGICAR
jgi:rhomboid protease GluP